MHQWCVGRYPNNRRHHDSAQKLSSCNHQPHQRQNEAGPEAGQIWHQTMSHYCPNQGPKLQSQGVPFFKFQKLMKSNIWKTIPDVDGDNILIICEYVLQTYSNFDRLVIHIVLYHSSWPEEWIVLPCPVYAYWCRMTMAGPCWVLTTSPAVTIGMLVIWWLSMFLTSTAQSDFLNDTNIITSNTLIGTSINKQTSFTGLAGGDKSKKCNASGIGGTSCHWS